VVVLTVVRLAGGVASMAQSRPERNATACVDGFGPSKPGCEVASTVIAGATAWHLHHGFFGSKQKEGFV